MNRAQPDPQEPAELSQWLTRNAVSDLVSLTPKTLIRMEARGEFPLPAKLPNGRVRYIREEVASWMQRQASSRKDSADPQPESASSNSRPPAELEPPSAS